MRTFCAYFLCLVICFLPACAALTSQQRSQVRQTIDQEYTAGNLTRAQYDAAVEALDRDEPFDWGTLGIVGANVLLALVGGPAIVRLQRGKPTKTAKAPAC